MSNIGYLPRPKMFNDPIQCGQVGTGTMNGSPFVWVSFPSLPGLWEELTAMAVRLPWLEVGIYTEVYAVTHFRFLLCSNESGHFVIIPTEGDEVAEENEAYRVVEEFIPKLHSLYYNDPLRQTLITFSDALFTQSSEGPQ